MKTNLALLTPTRNRKRCFSLVEKYIAAQSVGYSDWLVCNDGIEPYSYTMGQRIVTRTPSTLPSICANYLALVRAADHDRVCFIEDDEWYGPAFLETVNGLLDEAPLVGLVPAYYYNVACSAYCTMGNDQHASLSVTACRAEVLPLVEQACLAGEVFIDLYVWRKWAGKKVLRHHAPPLSVGLKGCPGEPGIGLGHALVEPVDVDGSVLKNWVGKDADYYKGN